MSTRFDDLVFEAIQGHTQEDPQDLVGILGYVDGREKLVLTHEELSGALQRLIDAGRIRQSSRGKFYEPNERNDPGSFSGHSPREHAAACKRYAREFWRKYRELSGE